MVNATTGAPIPRTLDVDVDWLIEDVEAAGDLTYELDAVVEKLEDLCDPRLAVPEPATLREWVRELVSDIDHTSERLSILTSSIAQRLRDGLDDDGELSMP